MREVIATADEALADGEQCVLCTVVRLDGSGYGRPGARLLLTESREQFGYISGGCLEKYLCRRAWDATSRGPRLLAFDTRGSVVHENRYNTGCDGVVSVLCTRLISRQDAPIAFLRSVYESGEAGTLLTVYRSQSSSLHVGDMARFTPREGVRLSPAGKLPAQVIDVMHSRTRHRTIEWRDAQHATIEAAVERIEPPLNLVIFGAGDDAVALARAAALLDWNVTVVASRPELVSAARFPNVHVLCGPLHLVASQLAMTKRSAVVLMTHDLTTDTRLLPLLLDSPVSSIGVLGSKQRLARLVAQVYEQGRTILPVDTQRLRCPIGLDIGAASPAEIAASIVAELVALDRGREGGMLTRVKHRLHDDMPHLKLSIPAPHLVAATSPAFALPSVESIR